MTRAPRIKPADHLAQFRFHTLQRAAMHAIGNTELADIAAAQAAYHREQIPAAYLEKLDAEKLARVRAH